MTKNSLKDEIRNYVIEHNNTVSSQEVINYILEKKKINTTLASIKCTLVRVLKETGGKLIPYSKPYGLTAEIRNYVKEHNNEVTSQEVINYILEEKKIKTTPASIKCILIRFLKKTGGKLIPNSKTYSLIAEIRNYVKEHNNTVSSQEVINYILEEKKIKTTPGSIKCSLLRVLKETGGKLIPYSKPYGLTAEIRDYVKEHNNEVTNQEVINYILEEKRIKTTSASIKEALYRVLKETGGKLIRVSKK